MSCVFVRSACVVDTILVVPSNLELRNLQMQLLECFSQVLHREVLVSLLLVVEKSKAVPLHAMEALGGRGSIYLLLTHDLGTRWGECSASHPARVYRRGERTSCTHLTGG
jgi:hypothetical protein